MTTTTSGAGSQACAACKYQRRKCAPDCPLSPFFPSTRQQDFLNAHKLFGVSNILKILKKLNSFDQKRRAVNTIIYQANARARDPIGGCYRIIRELNSQIQFCEVELNLVRQKIAFHQRLVVPTTVSAYDDIAVESCIVSSGEALPQQGQSSVVVDGDYEPKEDHNVKIEIMEELPDDALRYSADISEDVKPYLGGFDERDNTVDLDSKEFIQSSDKVVLKEDDKPVQQKQSTI